MSVQELADALQKALNLSVVSGQIVLNLTQSQVQSVETKTFQRIGPKKSLDAPRHSGAK